MIRGLRAGILLVLAAGGASAQQTPTLPILARFPLAGAGGDPQTAIAQARTSDQVSVTIGSSIQSSLGPYGDPFGLRADLAGRGITSTVSGRNLPEVVSYQWPEMLTHRIDLGQARGH